MSRPILEVENVSKCYRLGTIGATSFRETFIQWTERLRGNTPPRDEKEFWALRDVSFSVQPGEVVGIIGRNGAGKSTLLKILSRITEPTSGRARMRGRVASLLEVGTGFHPDLTGRENIFLNGAILGMTRAEVRQKFDEIVAFAEVDKFIDTPVKRYSSGMYVRLAFAVAAHLEPEILIVDEVLAVGDAQFQKKCLGKMQDVSARDGRAVLFVSHSMPAVSRLTHRCVLLNSGSVELDGPTQPALARYLELGQESLVSRASDVEHAPRIPGGNQAATFLRIGFAKPNPIFEFGESLIFAVTLRANRDVTDLRFSITIFGADSSPVGRSCTRAAFDVAAGEIREFQFRLNKAGLAPGRYSCVAALGSFYGLEHVVDFDIVPDVLHFEISPIAAEAEGICYWNEAWGRVSLPEMDQQADVDPVSQRR